MNNSSTSTNAHRTNSFDEKVFAFISSLAHQDAGLLIPIEKASMVFARLSKRIKILSLPNYEAYCKLLQSSEGQDERRNLISILTTNVTSFLRENHHFDVLMQDIIPKLIEKCKDGKRARIWSAGCSTGQEPYSIAMTILSVWPQAADHDFKILATDVDPIVLDTAKAGEYPSKDISKLPTEWITKFFHPSEQDMLAVKKEAKRLIVFRELNLMHPWPFKGQFDVIFCRNVVIYFSQETQNILWPRFENACLPGGTMFVGHSERIELDHAPSFQMVGHTMYKRRLGMLISKNDC